MDDKSESDVLNPCEGATSQSGFGGPFWEQAAVPRQRCNSDLSGVVAQSCWVPRGRLRRVMTEGDFCSKAQSSMRVASG